MAGESARDVAARSRAKAGRLMRHAEMYERGAEGEARTATALAALPSDWVSVHDIAWPRRRFANIDHIVLGPGGIFVVDSKNWSGRVAVKGETLRQNGRSREREVAACADSALAVGELLGPLAAHVSPVLCFVRNESVTGWVRDVMICTTDNLAQMLLSRPVVLGPEQLAEAWARLGIELRSAQASGPRLTTGAASHSDSLLDVSRAVSSYSPVRKSRRTASGPSFGRFVVGLIMLLGLVAFGPELATAIGGVISSQVSEIAQDNETCPTPATGASAKGRPATPKPTASSSC